MDREIVKQKLYGKRTCSGKRAAEERKNFCLI